MREIILFGTGWQAEKFIYNYGKIYDVKYVLDFSPKNRKFLDKYDVYEPTQENCSRYFIICACDYYMSKCHAFMESIGKEELKDFVWYEWDNKKMIVLNANCYGPQIKKYLKSNAEFDSNFYFYPVPQVFSNPDGMIDEHIMRNCDIFMHQDIRKDNGYSYKLSDEYLLKQIPAKAISITIPNLVGFGSVFYRQAVPHNALNRAFQGAPYGLFPAGDNIVDMLCEKKVSTEYILARCRDAEWFTKSDIRTKLNLQYKKYKEREVFWDIKIIDYFMSFYRDKKIFYDVEHPANFIMRKICEDILEKLGIHARLPLLSKPLNSYEMPIYPDIKEKLDLSWGGTEEYIRVDSPYKLYEGNMDMEEYIREYIFWCHPGQY